MHVTVIVYSAPKFSATTIKLIERHFEGIAFVNKKQQNKSNSNVEIEFENER